MACRERACSRRRKVCCCPAEDQTCQQHRRLSCFPVNRRLSIPGTLAVTFNPPFLDPVDRWKTHRVYASREDVPRREKSGARISRELWSWTLSRDDDNDDVKLKVFLLIENSNLSYGWYSSLAIRIDCIKATMGHGSFVTEDGCLDKL